MSSEAAELLYHWGTESGYSSAQALWLALGVWTGPGWSNLARQGQWSADERVRFLLAFRDRCETLSEPLSPELLTRSCQLFRKLLLDWRQRLPGSFLPRLVVLVEGPTEAMLLPYFAHRLGLNLDACAVAILAAGGAKQVVRKFLELRDTVRLPIVVMLDADAALEAATLADMLRASDRLHMLSEGEIEDSFQIDNFVQLINEHLGQSRFAHPVSAADFRGRGRRTRVLNQLWKARGLGDFDKIGFARTVVNSSLGPGQLPVDMTRIIESVRQLLGDELGGQDRRQL